MLKNLPPPGTIVSFVREVRKARVNDTAKLVRAVRTDPRELPGDVFEVEYRGEKMLVERQDIALKEQRA